MDLFIRLVYDACVTTRNFHPLHQLALAFIDLNAAVNMLRGTKRCQFLRFHVTELGIRADEIGTPRCGRGAKLFGWLAGVVGHDELVLHPGRTNTGVSLGGCGLVCIQLSARWTCTEMQKANIYLLLVHSLIHRW